MVLDLESLKLDQDLLEFVKIVRRRLRLDWDLVIAISGEEGSSKSTLAMILGALIDRKFDLEKNVSFLPDEQEIKREFSALRKYQCYVIDEAIKSLYKMHFMSSLQQSLVQMWATERYQNKCTMLVIPRFKDLTENFRNHRVKIWIHLMARGVAVVYIRDDDAHTVDPWQFDYMAKLKFNKFKKRNVASIPIGERLKVERSLRNYFFDFTFPDMVEEDRDEYKRLKLESRQRYLLANQEVDKEGTAIKSLRSARNWLIWYMIDRITKSGKKKRRKNLMCKKLDLTMQTINKILKEQRQINKEETDIRERKNMYTGVDRFLSQALEKEKSKVKRKTTDIITL